MGRNALEYEDINDMVDELLSSPAVQPKPEEVAKRTPHEAGRATRQVSLTFPSAAWMTAVQAICDEWGVRPSDFYTFCVSLAMRAIEDGLPCPVNSGTRFHHRAAECMDLPWEP